MKSSTTITVALGLAALLIGGCASTEPPRTAAISEAIDLSRLETFTVQINGSDRGDTAFGPVARNQALEELVDEFQDLGYKYVEGASADFVVVFTSAVHDEMETFATSYTTPRQEVVTREERIVTPTGDVITTDRDSEVITTRESKPISLATRQRLYVVDLVDASTNVMLWRGFMTSDDLEMRDPEMIEDYIERIVAEVPRSS